MSKKNKKPTKRIDLVEIVINALVDLLVGILLIVIGKFI